MSPNFQSIGSPLHVSFSQLSAHTPVCYSHIIRYFLYEFCPLLTASVKTSLLQGFIIVKSRVALYPVTDHHCTSSFSTPPHRLFTEYTPSQSGQSTSLFHCRSPSTHLKSAGILPHADPFPVLENVGCCRAVHSFPQYIHSNIMVNNPNCIPDRTQFSDLFIKTSQYSHFSASTKYEISFCALLTSFE